jgi:hypothetical protein
MILKFTFRYKRKKTWGIIVRPVNTTKCDVSALLECDSPSLDVEFVDVSRQRGSLISKESKFPRKIIPTRWAWHCHMFTVVWSQTLSDAVSFSRTTGTLSTTLQKPKTSYNKVCSRTRITYRKRHFSKGFVTFSNEKYDKPFMDFGFFKKCMLNAAYAGFFENSKVWNVGFCTRTAVHGVN